MASNAAMDAGTASAFFGLESLDVVRLGLAAGSWAHDTGLLLEGIERGSEGAGEDGWA